MAHSYQLQLPGQETLIDTLEGIKAFNTAESKHRIEKIKDEIRAEYLRPHALPWVIGYSGGKDSSVLVQLVLEVLLDLPKSDRKRRVVWVVSNDTTVESPLVLAYMKKSLAKIDKAVTALDLGVRTQITQPLDNQKFMVLLIGKGYMPPTRNFRWCTTHLKIQPTERLMKGLVKESGAVILMLGVRRAESVNRARSIAKYEGDKRIAKHGGIKGCWVFRPIKDLVIDDIWQVLLRDQGPIWEKDFSELLDLYSDAAGVECAVMIEDEAPACGSTSPRFGCWTCTVASKDEATQGLVKAGYQRFEHLSNFRNWLKVIREDKTLRTKRRRNGKFEWKENGKLRWGPLSIDARRMILERLLETQEAYGEELISPEDIAIIQQQWVDDEKYTEEMIAKGFVETDIPDDIVNPYLL